MMFNKKKKSDYTLKYSFYESFLVFSLTSIFTFSIFIAFLFFVDTILKYERIGQFEDSLWNSAINCLIFLLAYLILIIILALNRSYKNRTFRNRFKKFFQNYVVNLFAIALALGTMQIFYTKFSPVNYSKIYAHELITLSLNQNATVISSNLLTGNLIEDQNGNWESGIQGVAWRTGIEGKIGFKDADPEATQVYSNSFKKNNNNFKDWNMERSGSVQGGILIDRDRILEESLNEEKRILSYLKKDNFSTSNDLIVRNISIQDLIRFDCYNLTYKITFEDGSSETNTEKNCSDYSAAYSATRITALSTENYLNKNYKITKSIEAWVTLDNEKFYQNSNKFPKINVVGFSEANNSNIKTKVCLEAKHKGAPDNTYIILLQTEQRENYTINSLKPMSKGECKF